MKRIYLGGNNLSLLVNRITDDQINRAIKIDTDFIIDGMLYYKFMYNLLYHSETVKFVNYSTERN